MHALLKACPHVKFHNQEITNMYTKHFQLFPVAKISIDKTITLMW